MKKLEELGISPAPWKFLPRDEIGADVKCSWRGIARKRHHTIVVRDTYVDDARFIASAPKLYEEQYNDCLTLRTIVNKLHEGCEILNLSDVLEKMADRMETVLIEAARGREANNV